MFNMGMFRRKTETDLAPLEARIVVLEKLTDGLAEWATKMERRWADLLEEVEERIDRGNKQWRRVRAAQRREEELEDGEEDSESHPDLFGGYAPGGNGEAVPPMLYGVDARARADSEWEEKKRAINRALGGFKS